MRTNTYRSFSLVLFSVLVCVSVLRGEPLSAQTTESGLVKGKITNSAGAPIANAKVTLTSADTGQVQTSTTNPEGAYQFENLPPGNYRLEVDAAGFQTKTVTCMYGQLCRDSQPRTQTMKCM
jgi:hypothetical protein